MVKTLYIMRGLPGSGKTTKAREIGGVIVSHDDVLPEDREDMPRKEWVAVKERSVRLVREAMQRGERKVVVDNCHATAKSFAPYLELARQHGYSIAIVDMHGQPSDALTLECFKRTTHMTPLSVIREMAARWEPTK